MFGFMKQFLQRCINQKEKCEMTIEAVVQENTAAVRAMTAMIESKFGKPGVHGGDAPAAPTKPPKSAPAAVTDAAAPDYEKVVNPKILECVKKAGRDIAVGILAEFKDAEGNACKNGKGLQAGDYAAVVAKCNEAIAAGVKAPATEDNLV